MQSKSLFIKQDPGKQTHDVQANNDEYRHYAASNYLLTQSPYISCFEALTEIRRTSSVDW